MSSLSNSNSNSNSIASQAPLYRLRGHSSRVAALVWSEDGSKLWSGVEDGSVRVWDLRTRRTIAELHTGHSPHGVLSLSLPGKEEVLMTQGRDGLVKGWSCEKILAPNAGRTQIGLQPLQLRGLEPEWTVVTGSTGFAQFATVVVSEFDGSDGGFVICTSDGEDSSAIPVMFHGSNLARSAIATLGGNTARGGSNPTGMVMSIKMLHPEKGTDSKLGWFVLDEGGDQSQKVAQVKSLFSDVHVAAAYESGSVILWKGDGSQEWRKDLYSEPLTDFALNLKTGVGLSGAADSPMKTWRVENVDGKEESNVVLSKGGVGAVTLRGDGKIFGSGGWDGKVRLWSASSGAQLAELDGHRGSGVYALTFHPKNPSLFATGGKDGAIAVWEQY